jgi:class 3 adenylate cyclase/TolB-like protein/Tfp pilus assembly protein PilF
MDRQEHRIERRLVAIFAADVAGYSRLISQDEVGTLRTLGTYREITDRLIAEYGGRIANTAGDSVLAEFPSAVDAVQCAVDIQNALAQTSQDALEECHLQFRIGIHVGDVIVRGGDLLGDRVNIAARLQGLAIPGGICISGAAHDYVRKTLSLSFTDLGLQQMKNIEEPIRAYAFPAVSSERSPTVPKPPATLFDKPSLTVLPFKNFSEDREHLYFAEGLRDDLIAALLRFSGLVIIPSSSRPEPQRIGHPAADLGATYLLEGSVRRSGHHARVTTRLTGPSGEGVWAEKYDFELDDIFTVQDELARSIPAALKIELEEHERYLALTKPPTNLAAYDYYLRGRHLERSLAQVDRRRAISMFVKAIEVDPQYARGYLGLARTKILSFRWNEPSDPATVLAEAFDAAVTATTLDPNDAECHWALGLIHLWRREPEEAIACYDRARSLSPNHADLLGDMCDALTYVGRPQEAIQVGELALHLNPHQPDTYLWNVAAGYYLCGDYKGALRYLQRMAQPGPAYRLFAATYAQLGRLEDAKCAAAELLKINPEFSISRFAAQAPYTNPEDLAIYVTGLQLAGLPE